MRRSRLWSPGKSHCSGAHAQNACAYLALALQSTGLPGAEVNEAQGLETGGRSWWTWKDVGPAARPSLAAQYTGWEQTQQVTGAGWHWLAVTARITHHAVEQGGREWSRFPVLQEGSAARQTRHQPTPEHASPAATPHATPQVLVEAIKEHQPDGLLGFSQVGGALESRRRLEGRAVGVQAWHHATCGAPWRHVRACVQGATAAALMLSHLGDPEVQQQLAGLPLPRFAILVRCARLGRGAPLVRKAAFPLPGVGTRGPMRVKHRR